MTTNYDVAKAAVVIAATMPYMRSGRGSVCDMTHERVMKCVQVPGERQKQIARNLIKLRKKLISLIVPISSNRFYVGIANAPPIFCTPYSWMKRIVGCLFTNALVYVACTRLYDSFPSAV